MSEVAEHLSSDIKGLKEVYRVLKPGGIIALTVPNKNYPFLKRELRDLGINRCTYLGSTDCVTKISGLAKVTITALSYDSRPDIGDYTFGKYLVLDVLHGNSD